MLSKVTTSQGIVFGLNKDGVTSFKGIPYAAPPIGELRFSPPASPNMWVGERDCTNFGPIAPQPVDPLSVLIPGCEWNYYDPDAVQDEDCLNLNVWTPDLSASLPVLLWIHGGGWITGSGSGLWSDGTKFAKNQDVVIVSINYRLGALGYLTLEDPDDDSVLCANNGLLDQIAALRWVHQNIGAFGGDPSRICIFGESAGAISVAAILGTPSAQGLFSRAIIQSGHHDAVRTLGGTRHITESYLSRLGVSQRDALAQLRGLDTSTLLAAQNELAGDINLPFTMVVDGDVLPDHLLATIAAGSATSIPLLIGTNSEENRLFRALSIGPGIINGTFSERLESLFLPEMVSAHERSSFIAELLALYSENPDEEDVEQEMSDDRIWRAPAQELIDTFLRAGGTVYTYEFNFSSPVRGGELGACHALEIPFVFRNLHQRGVEEFAGSELGDDTPAGTIAKRMNDAWATFARDGSPTVTPEDWPKRSSTQEEQMYFSPEIRLRVDPHVSKLRWWIRNEHVMVSRFGL